MATKRKSKTPGAGEKCQRCGERGEDRRTLWHACFYQMNELPVPFEIAQLVGPEGSLHQFYTLRVCKDCRASWMDAIKRWFDNPIPAYNVTGLVGSGIWVRRNGAEFEITRAEWDRLNPGHEPVILKP